jgi:branched-chain amino acid transport system substrate-binding protein
VTKVSKAKPDAVIIATPFSAVEQTKALITQLSAAKLGGSTLWLTSQNLADYSQALPAGTMTGVNGILEGAAPDDAFIARLKQADPAVADTRYAAEAYDATILAALAAILAGDDAGLSVAGSLQAASTGGITCTSFGECLEVLKTENDIDYDGITGPLTLSDAGDVTSASFGVFAYGADNKFSRASTVLSD